MDDRVLQLDPGAPCLALACRGVFLALSVSLSVLGGQGSTAPPDTAVPPARWLGRSLRVVLDATPAVGPANLRLGRDLAEQKITIVLPAALPRNELLESLAALVQARWVEDSKRAEVLVLSRDPDAERILRERAAAERDLRRRIISEQKQLMRQQYQRNRMAIDRPQEEVFPGQWGWRGVPKDSEHLYPFLDALSDRDWDRLVAETQFVEPASAGTRTLTRWDPILAWPYDRLSRSNQKCVRNYMFTLGGHPDYSKIVVFLGSRNGRELMLGIYEGYWGEQELVLAPKGPALIEWETRQDEPVFSGAGPRFGRVMPEALRHRAGEKVAIRWRDLDYADACGELSRLLKVPVVADYYTLRTRGLLTVTADGLSIEQLFKFVSERLGCWFAWRNGMLLIRRGDWPRLDAREIPESALYACVAKKRPSGGWRVLDTQTLARLARSITVGQIPCLRAFSARENPNIGFSEEAEVLRREYEVLRFLGSLNPSAQRELMGPGLSFGAAYRTAPAAYLEVIRKRAPWLLNSSADGILRLTVVPPGTPVPLQAPGGLPPLQIEFLYESGNTATRQVQLTTIPWSVERQIRRK